MSTINEFLEEDVNNFLDEIKQSLTQVKTRPYDGEEVVFGVRDYEAEIRNALESNELIKAKLTYKDAKRAYGRLARNSPKRASLDLILKKSYSQLVNFCNKQGLSLEDEQIEQKETELTTTTGYEGLENQPKTKTFAQPASRNQPPETSLQKPASRNQPPEPSMQPSVNNMSGSPILSLSSGLNFPINLPDLKEKQLREKLMLEFKQKLELESEREYENLQDKYKKEREDMLVNVKKEIEENTKNEIQKLEQKLEQKFGEKYVQFKEKISQENKTNNLTTIPSNPLPASRTQNPEPSNQPPDSSPDENFMVIEIIDKRLNLLKSLITKKDYEQAKSVFNKIKKELLNINGYKKYKHKVYNTLKNTYPLLNFKKSKEILEIKEVEEIKSLPKPTTEHLEELNKKYFEGISAIKTNNKSLALKIFLELAKEHPNNKAIKIRLKDALTLGV